jgi:hypothetical protein
MKITRCRVTCDYCDRVAELVTGAAIYPHRPDLFGRRFWRCAPCGAWTGCHEPGKGQGDGTKPLGRLANAELRRAKQAAHAAFDPLWKSRSMSRHEAYRWLAGELGISFENCHIGMFDVDGCRAVVSAVRALSESGAATR